MRTDCLVIGREKSIVLQMYDVLDTIKQSHSYTVVILVTD